MFWLAFLSALQWVQCGYSINLIRKRKQPNSHASMWISKLIVDHGADQTMLDPRLAVVHELFGGN
jgi:hypothetical protein